MWSQYSAMAQHGELGEPVNLRPFSGSRGANRIMTVGAVSASIPIDPSARSIRLVNSGSSICYVRIGQGEQTATSADVAVFGNSEVVLSKGEGEGTLAFISASGTTLQAQTGSGGTVPGYQVVDQLFLTGDGVTQSGQLVDQFGRTVKPVGDAALTRTDWQGTVALSPGARTNLCLGSQTIGSGQWTNINVAVSVSGVAPDGSSTGCVLTDTLPTVAYTQSASMPVAPATNIPVSLYIKSGTTTITQIRIWDGGVGTMIADQNISWDGDTPSLGGMTGYTSVSLTKNTGGWYKFSAFVNSGAFTAIRLLIYPDAATNLGSVSIWGAMAGSTGAYIPTTTAPVTVTDYTLGAGGLITLGEVPVVDAQLKWSGIAIHT